MDPETSFVAYLVLASAAPIAVVFFVISTASSYGNTPAKLSEVLVLLALLSWSGFSVLAETFWYTASWILPVQITAIAVNVGFTGWGIFRIVSSGSKSGRTKRQNG